METIAQLKALKEEIDQKLQAAIKQEREVVLTKVRELVSTFDLRESEIFGSKSIKVKTKVAAKYYNPATGDKWTGRGRVPKWLEGKDKLSFLIKN